VTDVVSPGSVSRSLPTNTTVSSITQVVLVLDSIERNSRELPLK
jgi:hypothetical protein